MSESGPVRAGFVASEDGVPLYWRRVGVELGEPPIVCCNGAGVSIQFYKYLVDAFRDRQTVLTWDYRGHGRSGPPLGSPDVADLSVERNTRDLAAVIAAAELQGPVVLVGHSVGCQVILEFAHQFPERVAGLVLMFGTFGRTMDTFLDTPIARPVFDWLTRLTTRLGRRGTRFVLPFYASPVAYGLGGSVGFLDPHYAGRADIEEYLGHLASLDPRLFLRIVAQATEHDAEPYLGELRAPVLILASERDLFTPLHRSTAMADKIPGSELLVLAEATHAAIVEHPDTINRRIRRFLDERLG